MAILEKLIETGKEVKMVFEEAGKSKNMNLAEYVDHIKTNPYFYGKLTQRQVRLLNSSVKMYEKIDQDEKIWDYLLKTDSEKTDTLDPYKKLVFDSVSAGLALRHKKITGDNKEVKESFEKLKETLASLKEHEKKNGS